MEWNTESLLSLAPMATGMLVLVLAVCGFVWVFINATAQKVAPLAALLVGFCLETYFVKQPFLQLGLQIYPNDAVSVFVLLATAVGFAYRPLPVNQLPFLLWLGFGGVMIASLVLGLNDYGRAAGTEVRPFFYMWVAGLYGCTAQLSEADLLRVGRWCVWAAYTLIGIAAYYLVAVELGLVSRAVLFDDLGLRVFRPVGSHAAFFVVGVGLVQTMMWLRGSGTRLAGLHAATFFAFAAIIQHRSVWIAGAAGLLCVFLIERRHLPRRFGLLLGFSMAVLFTITALASFGYLDNLAARMLESTLSMADSRSTFTGRVDGWVILLETWLESPMQTLLFGFPFGHGYNRIQDGVLIEFAPHNYYLDLVLRVGVVGALLFMLPMAMAIVHGLRFAEKSESAYLISRGLAVVLIASLVYFIAYPSYYILGAVTGLALAHMMAAKQRKERMSPLRFTSTTGAHLSRQR